MTGTVSPADRLLIERYFRAMQTGAAAGDDIIDLFADDAVYIESFGGAPAAHVSKDEIRRAFIEAQAYAPADMTVTLNRLDLEGDCIRSTWTCASPSLPHPMQGQDLWTIGAGKILRLETTLRT
jgi:ketosteroid isomerase-like protein